MLDLRGTAFRAGKAILETNNKLAGVGLDGGTVPMMHGDDRGIIVDRKLGNRFI